MKAVITGIIIKKHSNTNDAIGHGNNTLGNIMVLPITTPRQ